MKVPISPPCKRSTLLNNFPLYKTVLFFIVFSLAVCSLIHHVMFQGRNQQPISFQGLSDGDRNKKYLKLELDRSKVYNSS